MNLRMIVPEKKISEAFDVITAAGSCQKISSFAPTVENLFNLYFNEGSGYFSSEAIRLAE